MVTVEKIAHGIDELVINWHFTEACNYDCKYCFAKWERPNEINKNDDDVNKLLNKLSQYFIKNTNPLKDKLQYKNVRLNFAGGEPMLLKASFNRALVMAKQLGFKTSLITNAHYLINERVNLPKNSLDMIGISFDSQFAEIRKMIGRIDRKGNSISCDELKHVIKDIKRDQKNIKTKINTVVNKLNYQEDFIEFIKELELDKWKVLQVLPFKNNNLLINKKQFKHFVNKHNKSGLPLFAESNSSMTQSYLMMDPSGRFYQNSKQMDGYIYSGKINADGVEKALSTIVFDTDIFISRYLPTTSQA